MAQELQAIGPTQPVAPTPDPATSQRDPGTTSTGTPQVQTAEQRQEVTPTPAGFEVKLDAKTLRMYSEINDPATGRMEVIIPAGYQPQIDEAAGQAPSSPSADTLA